MSNSLEYQQLSEDYRQIEKALLYLERNFSNQPALEDIAAHIGFSEYHFQRLFTRWVGISPKRFLQFLTKENAKEMLEQSENVLEASYRSGLSGAGRLHDLFVTCEAVTPGEYKNRGEGLDISFGFQPTRFGECLLAVTERGICGLSFVQDGRCQPAFDDLRKKWSRASFRQDDQRIEGLVHHIFPVLSQRSQAPLHLLISGTNFQIKVWEALMRIPQGNVCSYENIATYLGMPGGARAVGRAAAENPIAVIIPCHRVIRKLGVFGGYRWGTVRKQALLGWEWAQSRV